MTEMVVLFFRDLFRDSSDYSQKEEYLKIEKKHFLKIKDY